MEIRRYIIIIGWVIFILVLFFLIGTAGSLLVIHNRFNEDQLRYELFIETSMELEKEADLFFTLCQTQLDESQDREGFVQYFLSFMDIHQVALYDSTGKVLPGLEPLSPLFQEIKEGDLSHLKEEGFLRYPKDFMVFEGNLSEVPMGVVFFRSFPDVNLIAAIGLDYQSNLLRFRKQQQDARRFAWTMLFWYSLAALGLAIGGMIFLSRTLKKHFLSPLYQIKNGLAELKEKKFHHRLNIGPISELTSISESFNQTAETLAQSFSEILRKGQQYRALIEHIPQKVFLKDKNSRYLSCNRAYAEDIGKNPMEISGMSDEELFPEEIARKYREDELRIMSTGQTETLIECYHTRGQDFWIQTTKTPVLDENNEISGILGIFFDITDIKNKEATIEALNSSLEEKVKERTHELERALKQVEELSQTDSLTGLYNRRFFNQQAYHLWKLCQRRGERLNAIMMDIDFFKQYNDHYGHLQGDKVLRQIAHCITHTAQRPDDLAARFGGEEFILLLPEINKKGVDQICDTLLSRVIGRAIPHEYSTVASYVTISLGSSSVVPSPKSNLVELIDMADQALYDAKARGRNQHIHQDLPI